MSFPYFTNPFLNFQTEKDLQQSIKMHDLDHDQKIQQIQVQLQEERSSSRLEINEKVAEIERLMSQISNLETEVDRLRSELSILKSKCDEYHHDRQGYEEEINRLRSGATVEEERATTTLVLETQAKPDEKHVTMSKLDLYFDDKYLTSSHRISKNYTVSGVLHVVHQIP